MSKIVEMERLAAAGLPVPKFRVLAPETILEPCDFGELTIVKPSYELASFGQGVELLRTPDVRFRCPASFPTDHPGRRGPMLAQRFIDCGNPMTCRVLTFFGAPIFTYVREATKPFAGACKSGPFETADFMPAAPDYHVYTTRDPDVLALASRAYDVFPEVPLQACDILRSKDGKLYILEVNPGGATWMFSSRNADGYRKMLGVLDLAAEFDALQTCAEILASRTRAEAR